MSTGADSHQLTLLRYWARSHGVEASGWSKVYLGDLIRVGLAYIDIRLRSRHYGHGSQFRHYGPERSGGRLWLFLAICSQGKESSESRYVSTRRYTSVYHRDHLIGESRRWAWIGAGASKCRVLGALGRRARLRDLARRN